jgi:hypothetical protein
MCDQRSGADRRRERRRTHSMVTALLGSSEMDGRGQVLHCDARVRISSKATRGIEREKDRLLASVLTSGAMSANWSSPCQGQK